MKIAVISDIHDHLPNLKRVFRRIEKLGLQEVIVCGDIGSCCALEEFTAVNMNFHMVFGNNDGDQFKMLNLANSVENIHIYEDVGELTFNGVRIAFVHKPIFARALASTGNYDVVFFGHTHRVKQERVGDTLLVNPGNVDVAGKPAGLAIYDTQSGKVELEEILCECQCE
ncbi:MAG: metallophosphoesterase [Candidatus Bipolaricaulia bacterium]